MALKRNKAIWPLLCFALICNTVICQDAPAAVLPDSSYSDDYEDSDNFQESYNFRDTDQSNYNNKNLDPKFDKNYWEQERKGLNFEEDSIQHKKKKNESDTASQADLDNNNRFNDLSRFRFIFIAVALIILGIGLYLLLRNSRFNTKIKNNILVNFNDMDEESLRNAELSTPLGIALKDGDYQTAYRLKYLEVLQQLIQKNLIFYKKEKTNYEYLLQLSGKQVYEPFRLLTFNFDGIWYGEMLIDKTRFESLLPYFDTFNLKLGKEK